MQRVRRQAQGPQPGKATVIALALLLIAQALMAAVIGTLGPRHAHRAAQADPGTVVLDDLRRSPVVPATPDPRGTAARPAHARVDGAAARHHHSMTDASVVYADGEALAADDHGAAATAIAALAGFAACASRWSPASNGHERPTAASWPALTHDAEPLEHPPRIA